MKELSQFKIAFTGLKLGEHQFEYAIDKAFFTYFDYEEFWDVSLKLDVELIKKATHLEFSLQLEGELGVYCDLSTEAYMQEVADNFDFVVKFGDTFNDDDIDILIIPHGFHEVDIKQQIYETILLSLPAKLVHPGVKDGSLKSDILDKLESLSLDSSIEDEDKDDEIDPRWSALKDLLTDN